MIYKALIKDELPSKYWISDDRSQTDPMNIHQDKRLERQLGLGALTMNCVSRGDDGFRDVNLSQSYIQSWSDRRSLDHCLEIDRMEAVLSGMRVY